MKNLFNSVRLFKPKRNLFDLTHDVKFSCDMGQLVPVMCTPCVPGDKAMLSAECLIRFAPLVAPVMHRFDVSVHYFFVPNRLLWQDWENWIIGKTTPQFPYVVVESDGSNYQPLMDYLGVPDPTGVTAAVDTNINAMPFAAYQMIWDEYYRDQNLQAAMTTFSGGYILQSGDNSAVANLLSLRRRCWEHDYFTAALPSPQRGGAVDLPLGSVTIDESRVLMNTATTGGATTLTGTAGNPIVGKVHTSDPDIGTDNLYAEGQTADIGSTPITDLRRAFKLQEWLERLNIGGQRYKETIYSMFGVKSPDARLQRPEYITGVKSPVVISEILNTTGTAELPQGNMAGRGASVAQGKFGSYYATEHGYIMGIMSVMPKTAYQQGLPKHFLKINDPYEHFWTQFEHIGEQEVKNNEVYAFTATGNDAFGYVPRYAEYKFEQSRVAGDFRSSLDYWHDGRIFSTQPALNEDFVTCNPDDRIFAVTADVDKLYCHVLNKAKFIRPMSKFGEPSF